MALTGTMTNQPVASDVEDTLPQRPDATTDDVTALGPDVGEVTTGIQDNYTPIADAQNQQAQDATTASQPAYDAGTSSALTQQYATLNEGDQSVTQKSLVSEQLKSILDPSSDLMMQQKSMGEASAASRGQLGSSAGIRAAQGAMIAKGTEIATADAGTYANANLSAQQARQEQNQTMTDAIAAGGLSQQEAAQYQKKLSLNNAYEAAIAGADKQTAAILQDNQNQWEMISQELQNDFTEWSTRYQMTGTMRENVLNRMSEAQLNHQIVTQELLGDPSFLELGGSAISNILNTMADGVAASIKSDFVAYGYASDDPGMNNMLDDWSEEMRLVDYSGI